MKKQLFLILLLALFAGTNRVFAQAVGGSAPQPITCTSTPSNPIAGVPYDYSAIINPAGGSAYWYATSTAVNPGLAFLTAGVRPPGIELPAPGPAVANATNYMNNVTGDASPTTTQITWTSAGLAANTPALPTDPPTLFVVVQYEAPVAGCANNVKVFPVRPTNAFVVDIMSMTPAQVPAGYGTLVEQCFSNVQSAVWNPAPGPDGGISTDFGTNVLYFEVVAANFTGSFTPTFNLTGLVPPQTADIDYGFAAVGPYSVNVGTGVGNGVYPAGAVTTALSNTSTGVSIYVRVTVHNNSFEGTALTPITLAVDAVNSAGQDDVNNTTCALNLPFADFIAQNLQARPTLTPVTPPAFLPVVP